MTTMMEKKRLKGGCHCGFIRYIVNVEPDSETGQIAATRCNCTYCQKLSNTILRYDGPSDFTLVKPASKDEVHSYAPTTGTMPRYFCHKCGAHVWMEGYFDIPAGRVHHYSVNVPTIDQPQDGVDLSLVRIRYWNGLKGSVADGFSATQSDGLKDTPWPNGLA